MTVGWWTLVLALLFVTCSYWVNATSAEVDARAGGSLWQTLPPIVLAQVAPHASELAGYRGLHAAAANGDVVETCVSRPPVPISTPGTAAGARP
jgi:hypothetical protein